MTLLQIIGILISVMGLLAIFLFLLFNLKQEYSRVFLALFVFCLVEICLLTILTSSGAILYIPHAYRTALPFCLALGPSLYYYVKTAIKRTESMPWDFLWHLIPSVILTFIYLPFYLKPAGEKRDLLNQLLYSDQTIFETTEAVIPAYIVYWTIILSGLIYTILSFRLLLANRKQGGQIQLRWITGVVVYVMSSYIFLFVSLVRNTQASFDWFAYFYVFASFILLVNLYMRPDILYGMVPGRALAKSNNDSLLTENQIEEYIERLEYCIRHQKPYLDQDLKLNTLAEMVEIPRNQLSWLINSYYEKNFNDYINSLRIDYIKRHMTAEQLARLTMEGIAYEAGFRSRNTFILAVKKKTGLTPTAFFRAGMVSA